MDRTRRNLGWLVTVGLVGAALIAPAAASATQPDPAHTVTICHRTNSVTNPYNMITVDEASVDGDNGDDNGNGDHLLNHLGDPFDFTADPAVAYPPPHNGDQWGDIIPPFYADGVTLTGYPTLNWTSTGQAIFDAGCAAAFLAESPSMATESPTMATESPSMATESPSAATESPSMATTTPSGSVEAATGSMATTTPSGSVEAATGSAKAGSTPPPTDADGTGSTPSGGGWQLVLLALSAVLAAALVARPTPRRARR